MSLIPGMVGMAALRTQPAACQLCGGPRGPWPVVLHQVPIAIAVSSGQVDKVAYEHWCAPCVTLTIPHRPLSRKPS